MIHELLNTGRENPTTGKDLAAHLNCSIRDITQQIERERREGRPICAATGDNPGYFLPADDKELEQYCAQIKARAIELFKTRQALLLVLKQLQDNKKPDGKQDQASGNE